MLHKSGIEVCSRPLCPEASVALIERGHVFVYHVASIISRRDKFGVWGFERVLLIQTSCIFHYMIHLMACSFKQRKLLHVSRQRAIDFSLCSVVSLFWMDYSYWVVMSAVVKIHLWGPYGKVFSEQLLDDVWSENLRRSISVVSW